MQASKPRLVLVWILCYVSLTFYEPYWRLLMRGLIDNREFEWDYAGVSGVGMTGSYWIVVLISLMGLALLYFGWRKANRLVQWLLLIWITLTAASSLAIVISSPGAEIQADTLGFEIPFMFTIFPLDMIFFILTLSWFFADRRPKSVTAAGWNRTNRAFLVLALCLVPVMYGVFHLGNQDGFYDKIGVYLTFVQWVLIQLSFYPWGAGKAGWGTLKS